MAYASVTQLKTWVDIDSNSDDALLTDLIDRAQSWIEQHTKRIFEVTSDTTQVFDAVADVDDERRTLFLSTLDLCQITSVVNGDGTSVAASDYVTLPRRLSPFYALVIKEGAALWTYSTSPESAIEITGRWGYSVTPPDVIVQATLRLAAWMYRQRDTGMDADRPTVTTQGVMVFPASMPRDVAEMLKPFVKVV